jgi:hypothetical protein
MRATKHFRYFDGEEHRAVCRLSGNKPMAHKLMEAVMHRSRVTGKDLVAVTGSLCRDFGVDDPGAKRRALEFWKDLGVWQVTSKRGKNPTVHILVRPGKLLALGRFKCAKVADVHSGFGVKFHDGTMARTTTTTARKALESARRDDRPVGAALEDYGTGWVVVSVKRPAGELSSLEIGARVFPQS